MAAMNRRDFVILGAATLWGLACKLSGQEIEQEQSEPEVDSEAGSQVEEQIIQDPSSPIIVVSLEQQTLTLYPGSEQEVFPVVVGKRGYSGNSITPSGLYVVQGLSQSDHLLSGRFGRVYGRRFISLRNMRTGSTSIGIHGTNDGHLLSHERRYYSKGCIRMINEHIEDHVFPEVSHGDYVLIQK